MFPFVIGNVTKLAIVPQTNTQIGSNVALGSLFATQNLVQAASNSAVVSQ